MSKEKDISVELEKYQEYLKNVIEAISKKTYQLGDIELKFDPNLTAERYLNYLQLKNEIKKKYDTESDEYLKTPDFVNRFVKNCCYPNSVELQTIDISKYPINVIDDLTSPFFYLYNISTVSNREVREAKIMLAISKADSNGTNLNNISST